MRLSDAGLRQRQTKTLYPNHRLPPWLTEDAPRDRSNRLLGSRGYPNQALNMPEQGAHRSQFCHYVSCVAGGAKGLEGTSPSHITEGHCWNVGGAQITRNVIPKTSFDMKKRCIEWLASVGEHHLQATRLRIPPLFVGTEGRSRCLVAFRDK